MDQKVSTEIDTFQHRCAISGHEQRMTELSRAIGVIGERPNTLVSRSTSPQAPKKIPDGIRGDLFTE